MRECPRGAPPGRASGEIELPHACKKASRGTRLGSRWWREPWGWNGPSEMSTLEVGGRGQQASVNTLRSLQVRQLPASQDGAMMPSAELSGCKCSNPVRFQDGLEGECERACEWVLSTLWDSVGRRQAASSFALSHNCLFPAFSGDLCLPILQADLTFLLSRGSR